MKKIVKNSKYYTTMENAWLASEVTFLGIELIGVVKEDPIMQLAGYAGVIVSYLGASYASNKKKTTSLKETQAAIKKAMEDLKMATAEFYEEPENSEVSVTEIQWQA